MANAILTEQVKEKWAKVLDEQKGMAPIKDETVRNNTIRLLENTEQALLREADPAISADGAGTAGPGNTGTSKVFDPMLISMIRRTQPVLVGQQMLGVQPMSGPTGLIFAMRTFKDPSGTPVETNAEHAAASTIEDNKYYSGNAGETATLTTGEAEALGVGRQTAEAIDESGTTNHGQLSIVDNNPWKELGFTIDKSTVEVGSRALKARYTIELAQDLKAIHGLDAETELSKILSDEIVGEIDREMIDVINTQATQVDVTNSLYNGLAIGGTSIVAGEIDLTEATGTAFDGRWSAEKAHQLVAVVGRQASGIARTTRRGRANWILCSPDLAEYLAEGGNMHYLNRMEGSVEVPDVATGPSFLGVLNGQYKVFVDPYAATDYFTVGYKGANVYDAGAFYCPYVPMQFMRSQGEEDFAPRIGFKTRYGLAANPYAVIHATNGATSSSALADSAGGNPYFRRATVIGF